MRDHSRRRHAGAAIVAQAPYVAPKIHISDAEVKFEKVWEQRFDCWWSTVSITTPTIKTFNTR